jgi:hypothetical protein
MPPSSSLSLLSCVCKSRATSYLFDFDSGDLRGLVLSCRTVKEEVYHEMRKIVHKVRDQLQPRWLFDLAFHIPFPARLFKSGELIIEVPYLPGDLVMWYSYDDPQTKSMCQSFTEHGAFGLGARTVLLRITQVTGTSNLEHEQAARIRARDEASDESTEPEDYTAMVLWMYHRLSTDHSPLSRRPEKMEVRLKHGGHQQRHRWTAFRMWSGRRNTDGDMIFEAVTHPTGPA